MLFCAISLFVYLLGSPDLYAAFYGTGFVILIIFIIKITFQNFGSAYREVTKMELYRSIAYTDRLTGLKNRNAFIEEQEDRPIHEHICCVIIDVNGLKYVNDTFGHRYGDELIQRSAQVIREAFSAIATCYRIVGDEFAILCENTEESEVQTAIEKMQCYIDAENKEKKPLLSLALGYAFGGDSIDNFNALYAAADRKMYMDKEKDNRSHRLSTEKN